MSTFLLLIDFTCCQHEFSSVALCLPTKYFIDHCQLFVCNNKLWHLIGKMSETLFRCFLFLSFLLFSTICQLMKNIYVQLISPCTHTRTQTNLDIWWWIIRFLSSITFRNQHIYFALIGVCTNNIVQFFNNYFVHFYLIRCLSTINLLIFCYEMPKVNKYSFPVVVITIANNSVYIYIFSSNLQTKIFANIRHPVSLVHNNIFINISLAWQFCNLKIEINRACF